MNDLRLTKSGGEASTSSRQRFAHEADGTPALPLSELIKAWEDRASVVNELLPNDAPVGLLPELIAQTLPHLRRLNFIETGRA